MTRYYLQNASAGYTPATIRGTWNTTASMVTKKAGAKSGTISGVDITVGSTTANYARPTVRFVTDGIASAGAVELTGICFGMYEGSTDINAYLRVYAYVTVGDSDTVRGVLVDNWARSTEFGTSYSTAGIAASPTNTPVTGCQVGDRIVVIAGYKASSSATTYSVRTYFGSKNATDLSNGANAASYPGWFDVTLTSAPTVTDSEATIVTTSSAVGNGNVTSNGGATITARGVVWGTSANPTLSNSHAEASGTTGAFTASMTGLSADTLYYWRMYATNSAGTTYSTGGSFTTYATSGVVALAGSPVGNYSNSATKTVTAGNLLIFMCSGSGSSIATPTSSPSITWNSFTNNSQFDSGAGTTGIAVFYGYATSSGSYTVTAGSGISDVGCQLWELSGAASSDPIETAGVVATAYTETPTVYLSDVSETSMILGFFAEQQGPIGSIQTYDSYQSPIVNVNHIDVGIYHAPGLSGECTVKVRWLNSKSQGITYNSVGVAIAVKVAATSAPGTGAAGSVSGAQGAATSDTPTTGAAGSRSGAHASVASDTPTTGAAGSKSGAHGSVQVESPASGASGSRSGASGAATWLRVASGLCGSASGAQGAVVSESPAAGAAGCTSGASGSATSESPAVGATGSVSGAHGAVTSEASASSSTGSVSGAEGSALVESPASGEAGSVSGASGSASCAGTASGAAGSISGAQGSATSESPATGAAGSVSGASASAWSDTTTTGAVGSTSGCSGAVTSDSPAAGATGGESGAQGAATSKSPAAGASGSISGAHGSASFKADASGSAGSVSGASGAATPSLSARGAAGSVSGCSGSATSSHPATGWCGSRSGARGWAASTAPARGASGSLSSCSGSAVLHRVPLRRPTSGTARIMRPASGAATVARPSSGNAHVERPEGGEAHVARPATGTATVIRP